MSPVTVLLGALGVAVVGLALGFVIGWLIER